MIPLGTKREIGQLIRAKRLQVGMSVQELAVLASVSRSYIYAIEAGDRGSDVEKLSNIIRTLGMEILVEPLNLTLARVNQGLAAGIGSRNPSRNPSIPH